LRIHFCNEEILYEKCKGIKKGKEEYRAIHKASKCIFEIIRTNLEFREMHFNKKIVFLEELDYETNQGQNAIIK